MEPAIPTLAIIGDVHGKSKEYLRLAAQHRYSFQLGDMGFSYDHLSALDPERHKFTCGNHDNHDLLEEGWFPQYAGRYGTWAVPGLEEPLFFAGGAYSVDRYLRRLGIDWWPQEELSLGEMEDGARIYDELRPSIVITHDAPQSIVNRIGLSEFKHVRTQTAAFLERLFQIHQPKLWVFGHHHVSWGSIVRGCRFYGLTQLQVMTIPLHQLDS